MKTFLISYDLINKQKYDYTKLIEHIKSYTYWAKPLESTWLVKSDKNASEIRDGLINVIANNDKVLVVEVTKANWASYNITPEVVNWFKSNI